MAVIIGSARSDENGKARGGQAGDQKNGKEVSTQNWYAKNGGWRVVRAKDTGKAELIAYAMQAACDNPDIGYDQGQRDTLLNDVKQNGYDPAKTTKPVETDCSALVRTCVAYAFGEDIIGNILNGTRFYTGNEVSFLLKTGEFVELKESKYQTSSKYLKRGDILCTKKQGHTVVVLSDGSNAASTYPTIRYGSEGSSVKTMQCKLLLWNQESLPKYGADGDFGGETLTALKAYQKDKNLEVDGICGNQTWTSLLKEE